MKNRILVVDDDRAIRFAVRDFLTSHGFEVEEADTCEGLTRAFLSTRLDAAVLDHVLPDGNAVDLIPHLKALSPAVALIILTGHGSIDLAVRAIKDGAEHFLTKPIELPTLLVVLQRVLENQRNRRKDLAVKSRRARTVIDAFVGTSPAIRELSRHARMVAPADSPILIQGETGSGKGVLAAWLHYNGPRADEAFVDLNCAGLSRELLETELFGHEKGAFTGAIAGKPGLFEVAHRGTVFLDEIGDVDPQVQPKLLKVVEEKRFRRLGDVRDRLVDVRLIAATHEDLGALVRERRFRSDLYFRISTIPLLVPPLRARGEDIPVLARTILVQVGADLGRGPLRLTPEAERALTAYPWPGNIRELKNVLERAVLLSGHDQIGLRDLRFEVTPPADPGAGDANLTLLDVERRHIERILRQEHGHVERAALRLGIPRSSLYQKLKRFRISSRV
ncbi:MAG TPA: sigma-54 dependent transcriptional regulator [Polyangia bacterium]|jgi:DNA-binding NtrC family response regulator